MNTRRSCNAGAPCIFRPFPVTIVRFTFLALTSNVAIEVVPNRKRDHLGGGMVPLFVRVTVIFHSGSASLELGRLPDGAREWLCIHVLGTMPCHDVSLLASPFDILKGC